VSGFPAANRREARKLGLLRSKSSEAERERMEAAGAYERVCGERPAPMLIYRSGHDGDVVSQSALLRQRRWCVSYNLKFPATHFYVCF
jgi:hypothetical protein